MTTKERAVLRAAIAYRESFFDTPEATERARRRLYRAVDALPNGDQTRLIPSEKEAK